MDLSRAKALFYGIKKINPQCDDYRLLLAYEDILNIFELINEIIEKKIDNCSNEFAAAGLDNEARTLHHYEGQIVTLLRAIYFISSRFVDIFLYDLNYRNKKDSKNTSLVAAFFGDLNINNDQRVELLTHGDKAFRLQVFRNNCIAHSKMPKENFAVSSSQIDCKVECSLRNIKLYSSPITAVVLDNESKNTLASMIDKYGFRMSSAPVTDLVIDCEIDSLFYHMPLICNEEINTDEWNAFIKIMDKTLCISMSAQEIVESIDQLIEGMCENISSR